MSLSKTQKDKLKKNIDEKNYYQIYKVIDSKSKKSSSRKEYYNSLIDFLNDHNVNLLKYLEDNNPFELFNLRYRKNDKYVFELNDREDSNKQISITFKEASQQKKELEEYIQRHLVKANKNGNGFYNELGNIIGYEVNIPYTDKKLAGIDLISIKDNYIYLIELKKCKINSICEENHEQLIRAAFEISTYYSYFKAAYMHDDELKNKIAYYNNGAIIPEANIKRVIIAPDNIIEDINFFYKEHKNYIRDNFLLFSISQNKDSIGDYKVGSCEELFKIECCKVK